MSKHTPGPWTFVQGGSGDFPTWNVRIGNRGLITLPATASMETMDADARLIASAPDLAAQRDALLEALRLIAGLITHPEGRQKALDAIAKVEAA